MYSIRGHYIPISFFFNNKKIADHYIPISSFIIKRQEFRHNRLKELGQQILKTASCLFVGITLGGPEKVGDWSHPGVAGLFVPVWCL